MMENIIMEEKFNFNNLYGLLNKNEKQICYLCRDWSLCDCDKCGFVSKYNVNILNKEEINDNRRKMVGRRQYARN